MGYNRILLKVSGEALGGAKGRGFDFDLIRQLAGECIEACKKGTQIGLVVGGGNFLRGGQMKDSGIDRVTCDQMGMLATVINGMALRGVIEDLGGKASVMSAFSIKSGVEDYDRSLCLKRLNEGYIVIFVGGTGNPFFTTDSAAALRASELEVDLFCKATKVDGVYDDDPVKNPKAKRYKKLTYLEVVQKQLGVMDITAVTLCLENRIPILVFNLLDKGSIGRVLDGEPLGTMIS